MSTSTESRTISVTAEPAHFFVGAYPHIIYLLFAFPGLYALVSLITPSAAADPVRMMDEPVLRLFWIIALATVFHQWMAWLVWRLQLCYRAFSRWFGKADLIVWGILFLPFLVIRFAGIVVLGVLDPLSLSLSPVWRIVPALILTIPALYGAYSVIRYFGLARALGGDHFRDHYQKLPRVREGAFKYTGNVMYGWIFLLPWAIALLTDSPLALVASAFQHSYIWVHFYCTEEPDMRVIYSRN